MNKRVIATYGTHVEADLTGIDWGKEVFKRATFKGNQSADLSRSYLMIEDDMSFMEPIFREGKLPFAEYLVTSGYHPMTQEILSRKTQDFTDEEAHEGAAKLSEEVLVVAGDHKRCSVLERVGGMAGAAEAGDRPLADPRSAVGGRQLARSRH